MKKFLIVFLGLVASFGMANFASADVNWDPVQTLNIPANTTTPTASSVLENGADYKITVSGTFFAGDGIEADAKYSSRNGSNWADKVSTYESYGETLLDLFMESDSDWGAYNPENTYSKIITGTGSALNFHIYDIYPSNNTGGLTVQIDRLRREAEITSPNVDEKKYGEVTFSAYLIDDDQDNVQWAVRKGTCNAGTGTVFGNVDGYNDDYDWDYDEVYTQNFSATVDTSSWDGGMYCFVFNPNENSGDTPIRLTREFYVADAYINGGGQLLEAQMSGKKKDDLKISFGGNIWDLGKAGLQGDWEVNFHNVNEVGFDKSKFHTTEINDLNLFDGDSSTCNDAMNFTAMGEWNGMSGYKMIFRAGDFGSPNTADTVRIELRDPGDVLVYDTYWDTEFGGGSSCVGSARTGLDNGNITIWQD